MKHFLPSSVMLTPFVVRYYEEEDESENVETRSEAHSLELYPSAILYHSNERN